MPSKRKWHVAIPEPSRVMRLRLWLADILMELSELLAVSSTSCVYGPDNLYECVGLEAVRDFVKQVNELAEQKMALTGKLEGSHYAAMQVVLAELEQVGNNAF